MHSLYSKSWLSATLLPKLDTLLLPQQQKGTMTTIHAYRLKNTIAVRVRAADTGLVRPLRLALLLDVSESMSGERLNSVKRTLEAARALWKPDDRVTLITFGDSATRVLADHLMDGDGVTAFYNAVTSLHTDGCTNLSAGLELLSETLAAAESRYDAMLVLTDGMVNRGVTATAGLQAMALGLDLPATMLGYGADHNRQLLRDLALKSHGSYTFCDSDEVLPVVIGQQLAELRTQVTRCASLALEGSPDWICKELGGPVIGSLVPDRDYWSVWVSSSGVDADVPHPAAIRYTADGVTQECILHPLHDDDESEALLVKEQSLRCRVARALKDVADAMETSSGRPVDRDALRNLEDEINAATPAFRARGLVLRLQGELAAIRAELETLPPPPPSSSPLAWGAPSLRRQAAVGGPSHLLARLSSQTAYLGNQRGVTSIVSADPDMFSSPAVRVASSTVQEHYRHRNHFPMDPVSSVADAHLSE